MRLLLGVVCSLAETTLAAPELSNSRRDGVINSCSPASRLAAGTVFASFENPGGAYTGKWQRQELGSSS
jgi:hypothetical protein